MSSPEFQNNANSLLAADELRRQIDQEIQVLYDKMRSLKTRRNTLAPINHLPPEILSKIFALTIPDGYNALVWIKVSYVSRYWREVALGCPSLWVNLVFTRPKWCEEMLERSKMASLVVKANFTSLPPKATRSVKLALLQGHRIRELQLCATREEMETLLSGDPLQFPMVRSLSLSTPLPSYGPAQSFILPKSIFNGETPYLRRLDLRQCDIEWDIPLFNGLTSLTIHNHPSFTKPTIEQLVNTLKRMLALEILDLEDVVPSSTPGVLALHNPIYLTQLTDLIVKSTVLECVSLVSLIRIPMTTRINFRCTGYDLSGILGIISNPEGTSNCSGGALPTRSIRALHIGSEIGGCHVFKGWSASQGFQRQPDIQLHLFLPYDFSSNELQLMITDFCKAINLEHLCSLKVALTSLSKIAKTTWVDTFGALPHLHSIHVEEESTDTLIAALHDSLPDPLTSPEISVPTTGTRSITQPIPHQKKSKVPSVCFPYLKNLTIMACRFGEIDDPKPGVVPLRNAMKYRSRHKAKLDQLRLYRCYFLDVEDVNSLAEVVKVDWDKIVNMDESDDDDSCYNSG